MLIRLLLAVIFMLGLAGAEAKAGPSDDVKAGVAALGRSDWNGAITAFTRAINSRQLRPIELVPAYGGRGTAYYQLDKLDLALQDLNEAIRLAPGSGYPARHLAGAYANRAGVNIDLRRYQSAIEDCNAALRLDAKDYIAFYYRAAAQEKLARHEAAIADYRAVLRLKPDFKQARDGLARLGVK